MVSIWKIVKWEMSPDCGPHTWMANQRPDYVMGPAICGIGFRGWWWIDETGKAMLVALYGNKRLEIKPKTLDYGNS